MTTDLEENQVSKPSVLELIDVEAAIARFGKPEYGLFGIPSDAL